MRKQCVSNMELEVLHEDNHIIVVFKPYNIPSQADNTTDKDMLTIVREYLIKKRKQQADEKNIAFTPPAKIYLALVHRLDRPTSGVMCFAKTSKAAARLSELIRQQEIEKRYLAVVVGTPKERVKRLEHYLTKDTKNNIVKVNVGAVENSKKAILEYKVLDFTEELCLLDINLITGRSHQIRAQLAFVLHPLYGDHKYSPKGKIIGYSEPLALCAYFLSFVHPITNQRLVFKAFPKTQAEPWKQFGLEKYINTIKPN